jgi:hypothetical protein
MTSSHASVVQLTNTSVNAVFRLVTSEILTKHCKMRFLDYEPLWFGDGRKGSVRLTDVG